MERWAGKWTCLVKVFPTQLIRFAAENLRTVRQGLKDRKATRCAESRQEALVIYPATHDLVNRCLCPGLRVRETVERELQSFFIVGRSAGRVTRSYKKVRSAA